MTTATDEKTISPEELAERLGVERRFVIDRLGRWPHLRLSRTVIRFTPEHVQQIIDQHTVDSQPATERSPAKAWGRATR